MKIFLFSLLVLVLSSCGKSTSKIINYPNKKKFPKEYLFQYEGACELGNLRMKILSATGIILSSKDLVLKTAQFDLMLLDKSIYKMRYREFDDEDMTFDHLFTGTYRDLKNGSLMLETFGVLTLDNSSQKPIFEISFEKNLFSPGLKNKNVQFSIERTTHFNNENVFDKCM